MNLEEQILLEHSVKNAEVISAFVEENPEHLKELLEIILQGDKLMAQRAAWVLGKFSRSFYAEFIPHLDYILSEIKNAKHVAVSRNVARVFMKITSKENVTHLNNSQIDKIVEISFGWVIDENEKAAVVAFAMYTLKNLLDKRSWIAPDLKLHIENNMLGSLPSFQSAGKKVLKSINLSSTIDFDSVMNNPFRKSTKEIQ